MSKASLPDCEDIVEQAKAEVDDIVSEANFINAAPEAEAE